MITCYYNDSHCISFMILIFSPKTFQFLLSSTTDCFNTRFYQLVSINILVFYMLFAMNITSMDSMDSMDSVDSMDSMDCCMTKCFVCSCSALPLILNLKLESKHNHVGTRLKACKVFFVWFSFFFAFLLLVFY